MYQYTCMFVLTKWRKSIQVILYGILSNTKQYILYTLVFKKKNHILIYNIPHLECHLFQSDIHGYAWNFIIMKDLFLMGMKFKYKTSML